MGRAQGWRGARGAALTALLTASAASPAAPESRESAAAARLVARAEAAWARGRTDRAEQLAEDALEVDAAHAGAHGLLVQVLLAELDTLRRLQHATRDAVDRGRAEAAALTRERAVLAHASQVAGGTPTGVDAAIARRIVQDARATPSLQPAASPCPPEAARAFSQAEHAFLRRDLAGSAAGYHAATTACPARAAWHARAADVALAGGDPAAARAWFEAARLRETCLPAAHRGLAELDAREGQLARAVDHALVAVACDPRDRASWLDLAALAAAAGGVADVQPLGEADPRGLRALREASRLQPGDSELSRRVLGAVALLDDERPLQTPLLERLREARAADLLAEALLVETLDAELASDLQAVRALWKERLVTYVERFHLLGLPPSPN